jgi:hypothetical protein
MAELNLNPASLKANISVTPKLSQSVIVTLILVSLVPLSVGFYFLWHEKSYVWVPFFIFLLLIGLAITCWWKSQKVIDMSNASPTTVLDKDGNQIITDSRMLESANAVEQMGILFQSIGARQPLPEPDGLVNETGEIIENSQSNALQRANEINQNIKEDTDYFIQKAIKGNVEATQGARQLIHEHYNNVLDHNKPDTEER